MPTGRHPAPRTLPQAPVPLLIFRKIYLYGKSKKSTHHHRNTKPFGPKNLAAAIATLYYYRVSRDTANLYRYRLARDSATWLRESPPKPQSVSFHQHFQLTLYQTPARCFLTSKPAFPTPQAPVAYPTPRRRQTLPSTTPYMAPRREIHIGGNRGEGRLTLSESQ